MKVGYISSLIVLLNVISQTAMVVGFYDIKLGHSQTTPISEFDTALRGYRSLHYASVPFNLLCSQLLLPSLKYGTKCQSSTAKATDFGLKYEIRLVHATERSTDQIASQITKIMPDVSYNTAVGICNQCIQNGKSVIKVTSELDKARHLASELSSGEDSLEIDIFDTRRGEVLLKSENIKPVVKKLSFPNGSSRDSTNTQANKVVGGAKKNGKKWWWSLKWKQ